MMFDLDTLNDYAARGLIKASRRNGFTVWCYTQECVFSHAWDDVTKACRGLIIGPNGELVARPFEKFFNYDQEEAVVESGPFYAFDKMDGTLIVVGEYNGEAVVSTKGSFDTWHSEAARKLLMGWVPPVGQTAMFEFIHPENRIVIDYDGWEGLVLLGVIDNATGADVGLPEDLVDMGWHGESVVRRSFNLKSMLNTIKNPDAGHNREGFVVVWPREGRPWNRVKLKFDLYVRLHGIYTGLTNRRVWEAMVDGTLPQLLELAPDELHGAISDVVKELESSSSELVSQAQKVAGSAMLQTTRKEAAEYIIDNCDPPVRGLAFKAYDGKAINVEALKMVKPQESKFVGNAGLS